MTETRRIIPSGKDTDFARLVNFWAAIENLVECARPVIDLANTDPQTALRLLNQLTMGLQDAARDLRDLRQ